MPNNQSNPVQWTLEEAVANAQNSATGVEAPAQTPAPEATAEAVPEPAPSKEPIWSPELERMAMAEYQQATNENISRNFLTALAAARSPKVNVYTPPPVPPAIQENTRLEMEAGRKRVAEFEAMEALRPKRPVEPVNSVPVFRPDNYIPDPRKNQGHTMPRTIASQ